MDKKAYVNVNQYTFAQLQTKLNNIETALSNARKYFDDGGYQLSGTKFAENELKTVQNNIASAKKQINELAKQFIDRYGSV